MSQCICSKMTSTVDKFYEAERIVASRENVLLYSPLWTLLHIFFMQGKRLEHLVLWSDYPKEHCQASWVRDHKDVTFALLRYT